jgi:DNA-binding MarR family transcriptional regulator
MTHPTTRLEDVVHQRARLGILTVLTEADRADFTTMRDILGLSDGNLSRNLQILEQRGYVRIEKRFEGKRPRTWVEATPAGHEALRREVAALHDILRRVGAPVPASPDTGPPWAPPAPAPS